MNTMKTSTALKRTKANLWDGIGFRWNKENSTCWAALEYHREQTRPIARTDAAIEAIRAALASPQPAAPQESSSGLTQEQLHALDKWANSSLSDAALDAVREQALTSALAECRDAFPVPEHPDDEAWTAAMADPLAVPAYIRSIAEQKGGA